MFQLWIVSVYSDVSSCIINNGVTTPYFKLQRGVRQGDPLSAYLFILCIELLSNKIRQDPQIRGILVQHQEVKITQYADDTSCFVRDLNSLKRLFSLHEHFQNISGLKLNSDKTEAMWLGKKNKDTARKPLEINWKKRLKILGISYSYDEKITI